MRILGFESFDAGSHRAVREAISRHSRHEWVWLTLPGREWTWRMRTGAITMLENARVRGLTNRSFDAIFTTSLLSLSDLRAMAPAAWFGCPYVLYMHENQAAYPARTAKSEGEQLRDHHFALTNLTSILAADLVIWNSEWNRRSFTDALESILRHGPDSINVDLPAMIEPHSIMIWPPVEVARNSFCSHDQCANDGATRVAWPHRWEHDKGPDELLEFARRYTQSRNLRWTILGESFREVPDSMQTFLREFANAIDHFGYEPDRGRYIEHLSRCDWVLSTANHEFFGISVVEAMLLGCLPWLPDRLSYPELLPRAAHGISPMQPPADSSAVRRAMVEHLEVARAPAAVQKIDEAIQKVSRA